MTNLGLHGTDRATQEVTWSMWKRLWREWTIDKPAAFGDWLYRILVVELAALLDRLTLRQVIAFIPVVILVVAYAHSIPLPPELLLVGDLLAYLDIFSIVLLLSVIGRVSAILYIVKQLAERVRRLGSLARQRLRRADSRRQSHAVGKKRHSIRAGDEDDPATGFGLAWA